MPDGEGESGTRRDFRVVGNKIKHLIIEEVPVV